MQETGGCPDPQRQYARLLGATARAEKILRRLGHLKAATPLEVAAARRWLRLERYLAERAVPAVLVAGPEPFVVVEAGGRSLTLVGKPSNLPGEALGTVLGVAFDPDEPVAWAVGQAGWLRLSLARRLGRRTWSTLAEATDRCRQTDPPVVLGYRDDDALQVLGALQGAGAAFWTVPPALWPYAAGLWRHRGRARSLPAEAAQVLARYWPWLEPTPAGGWRWPQDEDIVHGAGGSPGGRTPGGRGVDV